MNYYIKLFEDWEPEEDWEDSNDLDQVSSGIFNPVKWYPSSIIDYEISTDWGIIGLTKEELEKYTFPHVDLETLLPEMFQRSVDRIYEFPGCDNLEEVENFADHGYDFCFKWKLDIPGRRWTVEKCFISEGVANAGKVTRGTYLNAEIQVPPFELEFEWTSSIILLEVLDEKLSINEDWETEEDWEMDPDQDADTITSGIFTPIQIYSKQVDFEYNSKENMLGLSTADFARFGIDDDQIRLLHGDMHFHFFQTVADRHDFPGWGELKRFDAVLVPKFKIDPLHNRFLVEKIFVTGSESDDLMYNRGNGPVWIKLIGELRMKPYWISFSKNFAHATISKLVRNWQGGPARQF